tara:strand:- start:268 stop:498 length:231 start_codon:yes stop_codon:yes gene_type:complete
MGNEDVFYAGNSDLLRLFNTLIILGKKRVKWVKWVNLLINLKQNKNISVYYNNKCVIINVLNVLNLSEITGKLIDT